MEIEDYKELMISELMRYICVREQEYDKTAAESQAVYSVWKLLNAEKFPERETSLSENVPLPADGELTKDTILKFTAHIHCDESLASSPDDRVLYSSTVGIPCRHFITDRYCCREVKDSEWK